MLRLFNDLKLIQKLAVPLAVLVAVMGLILWQSRSGLLALDAATSHALEVDAVRLEMVLVIESAVNAATVAEKNLIVETRETEMRTYYDGYKAQFQRALTATDRIIELADSPERRAVTTGIKEALLDYDRAAQKSIARSLVNDSDGAFR